MKTLALLSVPLLDCALVKLASVLYPYLYQSLVALWLTSLIRFLLLVTTAHLVACRMTEQPSWFDFKEIAQNIGVLSLLLPLYVTVKSVLHSPALEVLCRWWSWTVLVMTYVITVLVYLVWQRFSPFQGQAKSKKSGSSVTRLLSCMKPDLLRFLIAGGFLIISSLGEMAIPYYTGRMTDWIMNDEDSSAFVNAIMAMSLLTIGSAVTEFICDCIYNITMSRLHTRIQGQVFKSVVRQEIAFFDTVHTGDITSRITTDTNTMSEALSERLSLLMWYFMRVVFLFAFMLGLSWKLSIFTLIGLPIIMVIPELSGKFYQNLAVEVQESLAKANDVAVETFSSMKTVRSFANEDGEAERYSRKLQETYRLNKKEAVAYAGFMWTNSLSSLALKVCILYYGGRLVTLGDVSSGDLVAFVLYELQFTQAVEVLLSVYPNVKKAVGASEKIFEYMDRKPVVSKIGTLAPETLTGHIEFKNVTFSYPNRSDTPVLKNVSFELKPGEITALVGPSGGGKSTCVCLLERFYEPQSGEILLDGKPVEEYEHRYFHSKVALVSQEPVLFARSVEENIAYGLEKSCYDAIVLAAKRANAHAFISGLKDGYQTDAGEKGGQLSGGQKQRIAIARALLRDPAILILDDATSSLDTESEHMVQKAVYNGEQKKSILVIAHRLSTVEVADKIVVLDNGEVVEQGTHNELLEKTGTYFRLVQKQFRGFEKNSGSTELYNKEEES